MQEPVLDKCPDDCSACCQKWFGLGPYVTAYRSEDFFAFFGGIPPNMVEDIRRWKELPEELKQEIRDQPYKTADEMIPFRGPCPWLDLDTDLCKHHEHRPSICRRFPIGGKDCLSLREELVQLQI